MRTTHSRIAALFAATAAVALGVTGCSAPATEAPSSDEPVTIFFQWWGNDERAVLTEEAVALFEERNPGVTVETSFATMDVYAPKLATQVASGGAPDLFLIPMEFVRDYIQKGVTLDITQYVGDVISTDHIPSTVSDIAVIDGAYNGFTLGTAASGMIVNPSVWEAAGLEVPSAGFGWDDLIPAGEAIRAATGGQVAAMSDPGGGTSWFGLWLNQNGKVLFNDQGEVGFEEQDLVEWWQLMEELRDAGATTDPQTTVTIDQSMQNSGLARGLSASEFAALSLTNAYSDTLGAENVALAPLPTDTDVSGMSMGATNIASISKTSKHPEMTAAFLDFLINDPDAAEILGLTRGIPINTKNYEALSAGFSGGDLLVSEFILEHQDTFISPDPLQPPGVSTLPADFALAYETILFDRQSIEEAAASIYAAYEAAG